MRSHGFGGKSRSGRRAPGISVRRGKLVTAVASASLLSGHYVQASNYIWTNARADGSWSESSGGSNWINLNGGSTVATPGIGSNTSANAVFTDDLLNNISTYTIAGIAPGQSGTITIPSTVIVPTSGLSVAGLSFGDNEPAGSGASTGAGSLQLSTSFTLGSNASTITVGSQGISRENGTGTEKATSGTQTIASNITALPTLTAETWPIGGAGSGELIITGNLTTAANQTITKSTGGELELAANNSATFLGSYVIQGGTTLLDSAYSLGPGTSTVTVGAVGASVTSQASLLLGNGVTYSTAVTTTLNANNPSITVGGSSGTNSWAGAITMNTAASDQGLFLSGGTSNTGVTTFSGPIADANALNAANDPVTKDGPGTVILTYANPFGGVYTNKGGTTVIGVAGALGTGTSAVLDSASNSTSQASLLTADGVTFSRNVIVQAGTGTTQYGATLGGYQIVTSSTWQGNIALNQNTNLTSGSAGIVNFQGSISNGTMNFVGSAITKTGTGTIELSGVNTYSGTTTVSAGTLLLASSGALQGAGTVTVGTGGYFGGAGSVAGALNVSTGGTLFEGNGGIGSLTASAGVTLASGSTLQIKLQAPTSSSPVEGTDNDVVELTGSGNVFSAGGATLQLLPAFATFNSNTFANGPITYVIIDGGTNNTIDSTTFANLASGVPYFDGSSTYSVNYSSNEITVTLQSVPEPVGSGILAFMAPFLMRRRRNGRLA